MTSSAVIIIFLLPGRANWLLCAHASVPSRDLFASGVRGRGRGLHQAHRAATRRRRRPRDRRAGRPRRRPPTTSRTRCRRRRTRASPACRASTCWAAPGSRRSRSSGDNAKAATASAHHGDRAAVHGRDALHDEGSVQPRVGGSAADADHRARRRRATRSWRRSGSAPRRRRKAASARPSSCSSSAARRTRSRSSTRSRPGPTGSACRRASRPPPRTRRARRT